VPPTLDAAPITIDPAALAHAADSGLMELLTPDMGGTHVDLAVLTEAHGYAASSVPIADLAIAAWLLSSAGIDTNDSLTGAAQSGGHRSSPVPMAADLTTVAVGRHVGEKEYLTLVSAPSLVAMSTLDLTRSWARV
ncbi:hypothetical protein, partial [Streptomyces doudnae]